MSAILGGEVGSALGAADGPHDIFSDDEDAPSFHTLIIALIFSGRSRDAAYMRDYWRAWKAQLRRSDCFFYKRVRMTQRSFDVLLSRMLPFLRSDGDGVVGRPPTMEPHIRLLVVLYWRGHGGASVVLVIRQTWPSLLSRPSCGR